jgi:hypothetical protein
VSAAQTLSNQFILHIFFVWRRMDNFWAISFKRRKIFILQKKVVILIAGVKAKNSYRSLFKSSEVSDFSCKYIFTLINFIPNNPEHFQTTCSIHRNKNNGCLVGCNTTWTGASSPTFQTSVLPPSSGRSLDGNLIPVYMTLQNRRQPSSYSLPK